MPGDTAGFVAPRPVSRDFAAWPVLAPAAGATAPRADSVLIAATTWWGFPARLALACKARGFAVNALCAVDHPLLKTAAVDKAYGYDPVRPLRALRRAMRQSGAALVLPCDDRARFHLQALHAAHHDDAPLRRCIERSLGDPAAFPAVSQRPALIAAARACGIAAPLTVKLTSSADIASALAQTGLPAVMKVDGTWGGFGVAIVHTQAAAEAAFRTLSPRLSLARLVKRMLVDRDGFDLPAYLAGEAPRLSLQAFVPGRPANSLSVCSSGQVLDTIAVEALQLQRPCGAASVVRVAAHDGMRAVAERLAATLGLSGFMGLDFLIDAAGTAHLVEMNARATPLAHLCLGEGSDPVGGLARMAGLAGRAPPPVQPPGGIIAYFPQAWHSDPGSFYLREGFHDVPWEDPALLRELLRLPRPDRGLLARGLRAWRARQGRSAVGQGGAP